MDRVYAVRPQGALTYAQCWAHSGHSLPNTFFDSFYFLNSITTRKSLWASSSEIPFLSFEHAASPSLPNLILSIFITNFIDSYLIPIGPAFKFSETSFFSNFQFLLVDNGFPLYNICSITCLHYTHHQLDTEYLIIFLAGFRFISFFRFIYLSIHFYQDRPLRIGIDYFFANL